MAFATGSVGAGVGGIERRLLIERPTAVCLKLDISPKIIPRDKSIGDKILTLVPPEARTVREVKAHLANFVLKTPAPFHFYVGEYRVREEEDAVIFSLIKEPCRLMPVPIPKPALASTPKPRTALANDANNSSSGSHKRVTFFDGDSSTSPVRRPGDLENDEDVLDHSQIQSTLTMPMVTSPFKVDTPVTVEVDGFADVEAEGASMSNSSAERKKRRRRRHHRSRKSKAEPQGLFDEGGTKVDEEAGTSLNNNNCNGKELNAGLDALDEETESEDETSTKTVTVPADFDFVPPSATASRKRSTPAVSTSGGLKNEDAAKKKRISPDSGFTSSSASASFVSPVMNESKSNGKVRQDTPIVPRVIKNPRTFDIARNILLDFGTPENQTENSLETAQTTVTEKDESFYLALQSVTRVEELGVGNTIAFKLLELDERYNPSISAYKEGVVTEMNGEHLTINYTRNPTVARCGKYELQPDEEKPEESVVHLKFPELIEPKFLSRLSATGGGGAADQSGPGASSSPPNPVL